MIRWRHSRVVTNSGRISQIGTPREIYERPVNTEVAAFIGTTNFVDGNLVDSNAPERSVTVQLSEGQLVQAEVVAAAPSYRRVIVQDGAIAPVDDQWCRGPPPAHYRLPASRLAVPNTATTSSALSTRS